MPFKSEKQRRFLWLKHPDIAKRWAHEYPESNKDLPMYADKQQTEETKKSEVLGALDRALGAYVPNINCANTGIRNANEVKAANSGTTKVDIPHSDKPTYAGEEREKGELNEEGNPKNDCQPKHTGEEAISAIFGKLSAVLAHPLRKAMEAQQAANEGREPLFVPQNLGVRRYAIPAPTIAPPIGMTTPTVANPQPQPITQPGNSANNSSTNSAGAGPVGGGSNPQFNPINAFGPLGAKGQLNGNAAFGVKNSPDSLKTAAIKAALGMKDMPKWYGAEGLIQGHDGGYRYGVSHGVDVVDTPPGWLRRLFDRDPWVLREDVPKYKRRLKGIKGLYVTEEPNALNFAHSGQLKPEMRQLIDAALAKHASLEKISFRPLESFKNFMRGDEKGLDWRWGLLGTPIIDAPVLAASSAYSHGVAFPTAARTNTKGWEQLSRFARMKGMQMSDAAELAKNMRNAAASAPSSMGQYMQQMAAKQLEKMPGAFSPADAFNPKPQILYNSKFKNPAILAHELGHATGGKGMLLANQLGKIGPAFGTLGALFSRNESNSRNSALAGTISALPTLISEFDASRRGANMMRRLKIPGRLGAYVGVPTYALAASAPLAAHYGKKMLGGFDKRSESLPSSSILDDEKQADLTTAIMTTGLGGAAGALNGAVHSPRGYKLEGTRRGLVRGTAGGLGAGLGISTSNRLLPALVLGAIGADLGDVAARKMIGEPSWQQAKAAGETPAWQRSEGKNPEGGLNEKGRKSYERETGGDLKAPVTESKPTGERAKRQNSFCSRMCGMKKVNTGSKTKNDPDSRINKSLRKWNCKCGSAQDLLTIAQVEKESGLFSSFKNLLGAGASTAGAAARQAARVVPKLDMASLHPAALKAFADARKIKLLDHPELADKLFSYARKYQPRAPYLRPRMPITDAAGFGIDMGRSFGATVPEQLSLFNAAKRFEQVGQAAGRIPQHHRIAYIPAGVAPSAVNAAPPSWGALRKIVPGGGAPAGLIR